MLSGIPESAICVQRFDDSLNSAIHITYRISLRSSSLREPRDPLSKVFHFNTNSRLDTIHGLKMSVPPLLSKERGGKHQEQYSAQNKGLKTIVNDPTAGSPTVTLLRLVLPLNDQV